MTFSKDQRRAQMLEEDGVVDDDHRCPWCGEVVDPYARVWDIALEAHVMECDVFIKEQEGDHELRSPGS